MTPHEKAKELYHKYQVYEVNGQKITKYGPEVKVFTLIAVDEILEAVVIYDDISKDYQFWLQVKQELDKL